MPVAKGAVEVCGALVDIDIESGKATGIERVREKVEI